MASIYYTFTFIDMYSYPISNVLYTIFHPIRNNTIPNTVIHSVQKVTNSDKKTKKFLLFGICKGSVCHRSSKINQKL